MSDPKNAESRKDGPAKVTPLEITPRTGPSPNPSEGGTDAAAGSGPTPSKELTPEEQMALYEKDLKESDWGHQPC